MPRNMLCDKMKIWPGNVVLHELVVILDRFDAQERAAQHNRGNQIEHEKLSLPSLRSIDSQHHRQTTQQKHNRVSSAQPEIQATARRSEVVEVCQSINQVSAEHAAEKHDLCYEKQPHPQRRGVLLLGHVG